MLLIKLGLWLICGEVGRYWVSKFDSLCWYFCSIFWYYCCTRYDLAVGFRASGSLICGCMGFDESALLSLTGGC